MHEETPLAKWQTENDAREEREGWPPRPGFVSSKEGAHEVVRGPPTQPSGKDQNAFFFSS